MKRKFPFLALLLACALALAACTTATPTATQPATSNPNAASGQGESRATAAMFQSKATAGDTGDAPLNAQVGSVPQTVTVPFSLWNPALNDGKGGWEVPLDAAGKPYLVTSTAGTFNYSTGAFTNTATISGTASGAQTQAGTATSSGTQTATPTNTTTTNPNLNIPATGK